MTKAQFHILSDLHFDVVRKGSKVMFDKNYKENAMDFINTVKKLFSNDNDWLILAGDFFNDYNDTFWFFEQLELNKVKSLVVLGNHDYWGQRSDQNATYDEIRYAFDQLTADFKYCKYLQSGYSFKIDDITIIGDSGFTSFLDHHPSAFEELPDDAYPFELFRNLPDAKYVKDWSPELVADLNADFIRTYRDVLDSFRGIRPTTNKLLVITHWPFETLEDPVNPADLWYRADTYLSTNFGPFDDSPWFVSGHTHKDYHHANQISKQFGYKPWTELTRADFAHLVPASESRELITQDVSKASFKSVQDLAVLQPDDESFKEMSKKVARCGYARIGHPDLKQSLAAYTSDAQDYCDRCTHNLEMFDMVYSGYVDTDQIMEPNIIEAVRFAINVLRNPATVADPFSFYTALILTSYVYNRKAGYLNSIRLVNVYDLIRAAIVFQTLNHFGLEAGDVVSLKASKQRGNVVSFQNADVKIVSVNGEFELDKSDFEPLVVSLNEAIANLPKLPPLNIKSLEDLKREREAKNEANLLVNKNPLRLEYED